MTSKRTPTMMCAYSNMYHCHLHYLFATTKGWTNHPERADFFAGKSVLVLKSRRLQSRQHLKPKLAHTHHPKAVAEWNKANLIGEVDLAVRPPDRTDVTRGVS